MCKTEEAEPIKLNFDLSNKCFDNTQIQFNSGFPNACVKKKLFNTFPNKPWFLRVCRTSLLKTSWEMENCS